MKKSKIRIHNPVYVFHRFKDPDASQNVTDPEHCNLLNRFPASVANPNHFHADPKHCSLLHKIEMSAGSVVFHPHNFLRKHDLVRRRV
jgi:hypothetical protein